MCARARAHALQQNSRIILQCSPTRWRSLGRSTSLPASSLPFIPTTVLLVARNSYGGAVRRNSAPLIGERPTVSNRERRKATENHAHRGWLGREAQLCRRCTGYFAIRCYVFDLQSTVQVHEKREHRINKSNSILTTTILCFILNSTRGEGIKDFFAFLLENKIYFYKKKLGYKYK